MKLKMPLFEWIYLLCAIAILSTCAIVFRSGVPMLLCTVLGIAGSVLNGQGKKYCYLLTLVSSLLYAFLSLGQQYYGEAILHFGFVSPLCVYSLARWFRPGKKTAPDVFHLGKRTVLLLLAAVAAVTVGYGFALRALHSALPFLNALSTAIALAANLLASRRMREQWIAQLCSSAVLIAIWCISSGGNAANIPLLAQNLLFVVCNSRGAYNWHKFSREQSVKVTE